MSTAGSTAVAGGRVVRAPRPPALQVVHRAVARLTLPVLLLLPAATVMVGLVGWPLVRTL